jgi:hypothetical protein
MIIVIDNLITHTQNKPFNQYIRNLHSIVDKISIKDIGYPYTYINNQNNLSIQINHNTLV